MDYLSCFSGIGGLEAQGLNPDLCEIDPYCRKILARIYPKSHLYKDISDIEGLKFDLICGGWPCQDISVAGKQRGLSGANSGLFYKFLELAVNGGASTLVAENVPNLLRLEQGAVFREILTLLFDAGFKHISWRSLNARWFDLPHQRNRIFLIASKNIDKAFSLLRPLPVIAPKTKISMSAGFYWTAGTHSINYSVGYSPTLKIGSSLGIPSPPAVHYGGVVRLLSCTEAVKLQGFDPNDFYEIKPSEIFKMAGNAVSKPVGQFVMSGVTADASFSQPSFKQLQTNWLNEGVDVDIPKNGYFDGEVHEPNLNEEVFESCDLDDYLDFSSSDRLSVRAASGVLSRLERSGMPCPRKLLEDLSNIKKETINGVSNV